MSKLAKRFPIGQRVSNANNGKRGTVTERKYSGVWWIMVLFDGLTRSLACDPAVLRRLRRRGEVVVQALSSAAYVASDYYSGSHRAYRLVLRHPVTDAPAQENVLEAAMAIAGVQDGDEVRVVVVKTGRRPFGDRRVRLVKPHIYERESEAEQQVRVALSDETPRTCGCCDSGQKSKGVS